MYIKGKYRAGDAMASLLCNNYSLLTSLRGFSLPLGIAERTIEEVCLENGVHTQSFLAVANLILRHKDWNYKVSVNNVDTMQIVKYLRNAHKYYIEKRLPKIRLDLISVLPENRMSKLIIKHYDDYMNEAIEHMTHEDNTLFTYAEELAKGKKSDYSVDQFIVGHNNKFESLELFQDLIIKYFEGNDDHIIKVIYELLNCEEDLKQHTLVEDRILIPLIKKMEE